MFFWFESIPCSKSCHNVSSWCTLYTSLTQGKKINKPPPPPPLFSPPLFSPPPPPPPISPHTFTRKIKLAPWGANLVSSFAKGDLKGGQPKRLPHPQPRQPLETSRSLHGLWLGYVDVFMDMHMHPRIIVREMVRDEVVFWHSSLIC